MKELSVLVFVIPFGNTRKDRYAFLADSFDFIPVPENSSAGIAYNCNKDIIIDRPEKEVIKEFASGLSARVVFTDSRENQYAIGDKDIPAIVSINPNLNSATLKIECKMIHSPYSE